MRAAIYLRVSTEDQAQKYSLGAQREACLQRAVALGAEVVGEFSDPGVSGEILERPGLSRLRDAVAAGQADVVVALDPDRLARHLGLQILVTEELERAGCRLDFVEFEWQNTAEGQLFYHMRGAFAQYEKAKIKRRTAYGRLQKARRGQLPLRFEPYGYTFDADGDTLRVDAAESGVVRDMFRWVAEEGIGPHAVAVRLETTGVPAPGGGRIWHRATVARLLRNPVYKGQFVTHRYDCTGVGLNRHRAPGQRVRPRLRPTADWVPVPVPALVDEALWEQVQRALAAPVRRRSAYLLTGRVVCGECGAPMHGCRTYRRYYTCRSADGPRRRGCGHWAPADRLEAAAWAAVWEAVYDPGALEREYAVAGLAGLQEELGRVEELLLRKRRARTGFLAALQAGRLEPGEAVAGLAELEAGLGALEARKADLEALLEARAESACETIRQAVARLEGALDFSERQALVRQVLERAVARRGHLELHLRAAPVAHGSADPLLRPADADQDHE